MTLCRLGENWDGNNSPPPCEEALLGMAQILLKFWNENWRTNSLDITPTNKGSIRVELNNNNSRAVITFHGYQRIGTVDVQFYRGINGTTVEEYSKTLHDLNDPLVEETLNNIFPLNS